VSKIELLLLIVFLLLLILLFKYLQTKRQIRNLSKQIAELVNGKSEKMLDISLIDKDLEQLAGILNQYNDNQRQLIASTLRHENYLKESIANISHDLRTPLTVILGHLQLLRKETLTDKQEQRIETIFHKAERMKALIQTFYDVSVIDAKEVTPVREDFNLTNLLINLITENAPDLILSDVVMPGKDGYWLCREIKESLQLCHIPVILVTAKTTIENQVEGLNVGADAYVTKPFEPHYLMALIKSLLNNREKTRSLLSRSTQTDKMDENVLSPQDNMFMTELYHLMESELSNPELDVTRMTQLLKISRTKFYYKVKGLTGENPSVFFKTYKLNRAAELLKEGKYTISEIADMTGFNTLSHFSKSFKQQFGIPPSEYLK
jgi:AraC-like DNA-binding protein/CheY-like chemotaxis protein